MRACMGQGGYTKHPGRPPGCDYHARTRARGQDRATRVLTACLLSHPASPASPRLASKRQRGSIARLSSCSRGSSRLVTAQTLLSRFRWWPQA